MVVFNFLLIPLRIEVRKNHRIARELVKMDFKTAIVTLKSATPYSQSKTIDNLPTLKGEKPEDKDARLWMEKGHYNAKGNMVIPSTAMHQCIMEGAKYSKRQIVGQGKATWTAKFKSGIMLIDDIDTGVHRDNVDGVDVYCSTTGAVGSAVTKRTMRRFPQIDEWKATFEIVILDPIINEEILREMLSIAGMFIGIGRWRPINNCGKNGRFTVESIEWADSPKLNGFSV